MTEQWKPVPRWEGRYEVSSAGQVRSQDRRRWSPRGSGYWMHIKGRTLGQYINPQGHPTVRLGEREERQVRYLVLEAFTARPDGHYRDAEHVDGDPTNCSLGNLRWRDPLEALLDRSTENANGCWVFEKPGRNGYAAFGSEYRTIYGHRYVYERIRAEIPEGLVIDHLCRNRACLNPWHLEPVRQSVNVLRGALGGKRKASACRRGHAYTDENSYINPKGYRSCRTCRRERQQKRSAA